MDGKIKKVLIRMMESNPNIVGFSNQIRNGKIIVYVKEEKAISGLATSLKVGDNTYPIEYVVIGQIRALKPL